MSAGVLASTSSTHMPPEKLGSSSLHGILIMCKATLHCVYTSKTNIQSEVNCKQEFYLSVDNVNCLHNYGYINN